MSPLVYRHKKEESDGEQPTWIEQQWIVLSQPFSVMKLLDTWIRGSCACLSPHLKTFNRVSPSTLVSTLSCYVLTGGLLGGWETAWIIKLKEQLLMAHDLPGDRVPQGTMCICAAWQLWQGSGGGDGSAPSSSLWIRNWWTSWCTWGKGCHSEDPRWMGGMGWQAACEIWQRQVPNPARVQAGN